jgi:hypothetical protein
MNIKLEIRGAKEFAQRLYSAQSWVWTELLGAAEKSAVVVHKRLRDYPPQRPGTTYRRKGEAGGLKSGWEFTVRPIGGEVQSVVRNAVIPYARYVQGVDTQAAVHQGRWPTMRMVLREQQRKIVGFFEYALMNIRKAMGL